jgi:hypothetical protein
VIQNYDNFQDKIQNLVKYALFEKIIFIPQWLTKKCEQLGQLCVVLITSCKWFHSKILSYQKN